MQRIKIGILDSEKEYVTSLAAYLQQYGRGRWDLSAFTDEKALVSFFPKKNLDILVGTDKRALLQHEKLVKLWLISDKQEFYRVEKNLYTVYRFQSAKEIAKCIDGIVCQEQKSLQKSSQMVAIYSPVGRCGKTTLALEVVKSGVYGRWIYLGMEDYSSFSKMTDEKNHTIDEFLYYWKEHKRDKLLSQFEQSQHVLTTGTSFFDIKQIELKDWKWLKDILQESEYCGVIFDIGSGVLQSPRIFQEFDRIVVPYLEEERAQVKRKHFLQMFARQELEDCKEKLYFLNMDKKAEAIVTMQKIFGGVVE